MLKFFEWKESFAVQGITLKKEDYLSEIVQLLNMNRYSSLDYKTGLAVMDIFIRVWNNLLTFRSSKGVDLYKIVF